MPPTTKPLSSEEHEGVDRDEHLSFGHFVPNARQKALIALARTSFLHRGLFRGAATRAVMGADGAPLDVRFRDCAYRLRGLNNSIQSGLLLNPRYNAADLDFLIEGVPPGGIFLDIGANIGLYTLPLAKRAGPEGKVVAIDANRRMALRLAWNAQASGLDNIAIFPCAVSDHEGMGSLTVRKDNIASAALADDGNGSIVIRTLSSILAEAGIERIDGLKIDVEGHEDRVLAPFLETCEKKLLPARIVIERPNGSDDYPACRAAFARRGYRPAGRSRYNSFYLRT